MFKKTILSIFISFTFTSSFAVEDKVYPGTPSHVLVERKLASSDIAGAKFEIRRLLKVQPYNAKGHYYLSQIYFVEGDTLNAKKSLNMALRISPKKEFVNDQLSYNYFYNSLYNNVPVNFNVDKRVLLRSIESKCCNDKALPVPIENNINQSTQEVKEIKKVESNKYILYIFSSVLVLVGFSIFILIYRFNQDNNKYEKWLKESNLREQHIVINDLYRVLVDLDIISKMNEFDNMPNEIERLYHLVKHKETKILNKEIINIELLNDLIKEVKLCKEFATQNLDYQYKDVI